MLTYPHANTVSHNFSWSLMETVRYYGGTIHSVLPVRGYPGDGLIIARNESVRWFLKNTDAEWYWTLDTDIGFKQNTLSRLLQHNAPVVSGLYSTVFENGSDSMGGPQTWSRMPLAMRRTGNAFEQYELYDGVMEVDAVGAGCLLVHRSIMEALQPDWFTCMYGMGEDFSFCTRVRELGHKILCDTTIPLSHHKGVWL